MTNDHAEKVAKLKAEIAALRAKNDRSVTDAQDAIDRAAAAIDRKEQAAKAKD